jgi:hypothetical protein
MLVMAAGEPGNAARCRRASQSDHSLRFASSGLRRGKPGKWEHYMTDPVPLPPPLVISTPTAAWITQFASILHLSLAALGSAAGVVAIAGVPLTQLDSTVQALAAAAIAVISFLSAVGLAVKKNNNAAVAAHQAAMASAARKVALKPVATLTS